jgi:inner membrane protein
MDPLTHVVVSIAAGRAGLNKFSRLATPMLVISALAPDLDWFTGLAGPRAFLLGHRTFTHSIFGVAAIVLVTAFCFTLLGRKHDSSPVRFFPALVICTIGATLHVLFDLTNSYGVKLLWPFSNKWYAWDLVLQFDWIILLVLASGILLPMLFRLVGEEIGAQRKTKGVASAALTIAIVVAYVGSRYVSHDRAITLMNSRLYNGAAPLAVGAFPDSLSPLHWAGIITTETTLLRVGVPIANGAYDPFSAQLIYKPEGSAALDAARKSNTATLFLNFARFPRAQVERTDRGFHVEITDMRFEIGEPQGRSMKVVIDLDGRAQILNESLKFGDMFQR